MMPFGHSVENSRFVFIKEFLKHPLQVGSIIPSSRFLERAIVNTAEAASAHTIVELGSGTGGTTRAILRAMPQDATLLSLEINPYFHSAISRIQDKRLIAHLGNACDLQEIIATYQLAAPEVVIAGLPFSMMNRREGLQVIEAISSLLAPKGRFIAYQINTHILSLCRPFFGPPRNRIIWLNIPPLRLSRFEKPTAQISESARPHCPPLNVS